MRTYPAKYAAIRGRLKTGDLVFFGGNGFVSRFIRFMTRSKYSHVAIVLKSEDERVVLMESTTLDTGNGKKIRGVQRTYLSERIATYDGLVDIAPLSRSVRFDFDAKQCEEKLLSLEGEEYDALGAGLAGLGQYLRIPGRGRLDSLFCSELADAGHRAGGLRHGKDHTPTPEELSRRPIFEAFYCVKEG
jgi:hypothetical protein